MKKAQRILILSVAIGAGHIKTGEALCQAFQESYPGAIYHVDFMRRVLPNLSGLVENSYFLTTKYFPLIYKWLYYLEDRDRSLLKSCESRIVVAKYLELLQTYQPDLIISTHSFPAVVVSSLYPRFPVANAVIITDYVSHSIWVNPNTQLYFVPHAGMVKQLAAQGVDPANIRVTGIPVRPAFTGPFDRNQLQRKLEIEPGKLTVMIMSGGNAIGPLTDVVKKLAVWRDRIQLIIIAGHNRAMYRRLQQIFHFLGFQGKVLPFVENVQEYMAVSDLLITKAGGLTVAESLVMGLPLAIVRPTPGQEDGNTRFVEDCGAGIYLRQNNMDQAIADLLKHLVKLDQMRQKALQFARPDAAKSVLEEAAQLVQEGAWKEKTLCESC